MKDMELGKAYVDEFRSNIARPLQEEVKDLRMEIAQLRNAIQRIGVSSSVTSRTYTKVEAGGGGEDEPGGDDH